jgi:hypothetical protein
VRRDEFVQLAYLWTDGAVSEEDAASVFDLLVTLIHSLLGQAIEEGVLAAHEARATFRFHVLLGELSRTEQLFASLAASAFDLPKILAFETELRAHVATETAQLMPPYLDDAKHVPIDSLFVPPQLNRMRGTQGDSSLSVADFIASSYRAVVLGDPGGGKSTLAQKICHDLSTRGAGSTAGATPVLVTLREYGIRKRESGYSIKDFLYEMAHSHYQLDPPVHAFEYLLSQGRLLVVLDGLDELVDTGDRQRITADVEHFCSAYQGLPVIVTSRKVGYDQAPLDADIFEPFELGAFDVDEATEYATKWFAVDTSLSPSEQADLTQAFMRECEDLADLRSNALMLGLLCNIYRGETWIPRNRPEVYQKCALLLFERWDKRRGIIGFQAFESHLRPALEYLAHWIFCDSGRQGGVSESDLVDAAARYLHGRRFEDETEAAHAAREFIEFCRGRAWVFTDTGTAASGERLYQFTHRTFLEYFTAVHLVRTHPTPEELGALLQPRILKSEWEMVAQLACHIQDRQVDRAGDAQLCGVLDAAIDNTASAKIAAVGFAARALNGLVPRPVTARRIASEGTRALLDMGGRRLGSGQMLETAIEEPTLEVFEALLVSSSENWDPVVNAVLEELATSVDEVDIGTALAAAELGSNLEMALSRGQRLGRNSAAECWTMASGQFMDVHRLRLRDLARDHFGPAADLVWNGRMMVGEFLESRPLEDIFKERAFGCFPRFTRIPLSQFMLLEALAGIKWNDAGSPEAVVDNVKALGRALGRTAPPWTADHGSDGWAFQWRALDGSGEPLTVAPTDDLFFGLFGLLAVEVEGFERDRQVARVQPFDQVGRVMAVTPDGEEWSQLRAVIRQYRGGAEVPSGELPLDEERQAIVAAWARGEINLSTKRSDDSSEIVAMG